MIQPHPKVEKKRNLRLLYTSHPLPWLFDRHCPVTDHAPLLPHKTRSNGSVVRQPRPIDPAGLSITSLNGSLNPLSPAANARPRDRIKAMRLRPSFTAVGAFSVDRRTKKTSGHDKGQADRSIKVSTQLKFIRARSHRMHGTDCAGHPHLSFSYR